MDIFPLPILILSRFSDKLSINPVSSFQDTIEITVALLADPSFCKWTLKQSVPVVFVYVEIELDGILFRLPLSDP